MRSPQWSVRVHLAVHCVLAWTQDASVRAWVRADAGGERQRDATSVVRGERADMLRFAFGAHLMAHLLCGSLMHPAPRAQLRRLDRVACACGLAR
jgi:hypothetical protein